MGDFIRLMALISAAAMLGTLITLGRAKPGTTGFAVPWRYFLVAAGLVFEGAGIYYRLQLWGTEVSGRDFVFVTVNVLAFIACFGALVSDPPERKLDD